MIDYVKDMRKLIGNKALLLCGTSAIIFNSSNKILMVHRTDNNSWCFPGGTVELGENTETTVRREVYEETRLTIDNLKLFNVFSGEDLHYIYPNGDEVYIVDVVYTGICSSNNIVLDDENQIYRFFDIDEIPENISPPVKPVVDYFKAWWKNN